MKVPFPNNDMTSIDPTYRYMRDVVKIEKSGQFYVFKNIAQITKDLDIKTEDMIKYIQKKLGQSIIFDKNLSLYKIKNPTQDIEKYIEQYICETLVCKKCHLPEVKSNKICSACGNKDN